MQFCTTYLGGTSQTGDNKCLLMSMNDYYSENGQLGKYL